MTITPPSHLPQGKPEAPMYAKGRYKELWRSAGGVPPAAMITSASLSLLMISSAVCFLFGISLPPFVQSPNIDSRSISGGQVRTGSRPQHSAQVSELSGGDAPQAAASMVVEAGPLQRIRGPSPRRGAGKLRGAAPVAQCPRLRRSSLDREVLRVAQASSPTAGGHRALQDGTGRASPVGLRQPGLLGPGRP